MQRPDGVDPEWVEDGVYGAQLTFDISMAYTTSIVGYIVEL